MNLTKRLKAKILSQFKTGSSVKEIGQWYDKTELEIEGVLRQALIEQDRKGKLMELFNLTPDEIKERNMVLGHFAGCGCELCLKWQAEPKGP